MPPNIGAIRSAVLAIPIVSMPVSFLLQASSRPYVRNVGSVVGIWCMLLPAVHRRRKGNSRPAGGPRGSSRNDLGNRPPSAPASMRGVP